ncbi:50S ribosomal protein L37e [Candidatus Woesearchaeota archaeon]|nr:50S ribosomal protein L37e [Candidatus Woesearchaeota archaeon]
MKGAGGTGSQGRKGQGRSHIVCRRCGNRSYHKSRGICASCGYGKTAKKRDSQVGH